MQCYSILDQLGLRRICPCCEQFSYDVAKALSVTAVQVTLQCVPQR